MQDERRGTRQGLP
jgi:hypothetical protein